LGKQGTHRHETFSMGIWGWRGFVKLRGEVAGVTQETRVPKSDGHRNVSSPQGIA
jgi:hypothetical protein